MPGLTANGLEIRTQPELQALLEQALAAALPGVNAHAGPLHQLVGIVSEELAIAWEALQAIYSSTDPASASALALDRVAALTGTLRRRPKRSRVVGTVNLNAGATLPVGSIAAVLGVPDAQFRTIIAITNATAAAADVDVELEAVEPGPIAAPFGTLTVIVAPITGWNTITNALDAELGTNIEDDDSLRRRREAELTASGGGTVDAIRADLLRVENVRAARVFENTSDVVNVDGLPPHSLGAVVLDGDGQAIGSLLWASKPAGIETYGAIAITVEDSAGEPHDVRFSRPVERPVRLRIDVRVDASLFPADGSAQIQTNVVELGDRELGVGDDVIRSRFFCTVFKIAGVLDATALLVGFDGGPLATANLPIGPRELATFDTSRVVVAVTPV